jgi:asparagine synthase (glutamine-hydrolysing)
MCGINGILRLTPSAPHIARDEVLRTREHQARRGPDGAGLWESADRRVALAHNRLAILDLSPAGAQPMSFENGRYRITFNGEIYNFRALRDTLRTEGYRFRTENDAEVVLALYARDGVGLFPHLRGMYAFALWDDQEKSLLLARDPFGIKPLYYAVDGSTLRFASQVKALVAGGAVSPAVDPVALAGFLLWGSVPEPRTIRCAVRAVPAGHYVRIADGRVSEPSRHYLPEPGRATVGDFGAHLVAALGESVAAHMVSDVPVAVFLSAGLDSSLIAALARRRDATLTTLTVRFTALRDKAEDEGPLAARVAAALGTQHRELEIDPGHLRTLWPQALAAMDQPSIDGFNTFVIARAAHEAGFKVVLSGLGGDELFGGYPSFEDVPKLMKTARIGRFAPGLAAVWPKLTRAAGDRPKMAGVLQHGQSLAGAYFLRRALFLPEELPGLLGEDAAREALAEYDPIRDADAALEEPSPVPSATTAVDPWFAVHQLETARYMRNQLLRDADWAAMAHSVELRVPLVDPVLRAAAAQDRFVPARGGGKAAVVKAAAPELPAEVLTRKKTGFYVPVAEALAAEAEEMTHGARSRLLAMKVLEEAGIALRRVEASATDAL